MQKRYFRALICTTLLCALHHATNANISERPSLRVRVTPHWHKLRNPIPNNKKKIVLYTRVRMRSRQPHQLKQLVLQWQPKTSHFKQGPAQLSASLYSHKCRKQFIPVQDRWITDGQWDAQRQTLTFNMDQKLVGVVTYYVVVGFEPREEKKMFAGSLQYTDAHPLVTEPLSVRAKK